MDKKVFYKALMLIMTVLFTLEVSAQEEAWKFKSEKEGLTIYSRSVDYSNIKELKITATVKSNLGTLVKILDDVTLCPEWMYGCKTAEEVQPADGTEAYDKATLQFPKPFSYRVMLTRSTIDQDPDSKVVTVKTTSIPEEVPVDKSLVVIEKMVTTWVLTPTDSGEIEIESYLFCDPGGYIPAFLLNSLMDRGPTRTIKKLMKLLEKPEYQNNTLPDIQD
nr:collagenase and related proteases [uncultured bacterium]